MDRIYSEAELRDFATTLNKNGEVTPEKRQQWDLTSAYEEMDQLSASGKPITVDDITSLHRSLTRNSPFLHQNQRGRISYNHKTLVNIDWEVKPFAPPEEIDERIEKFLAFYNEALRFKPEGPLQYTRVIENALKSMTDFVDIHPFADGNGRMSRLLADAILVQGGLNQMPHWLPQVEGTIRERRRLFFSMVENARRGRDSLLLHFMVDQQAQAMKREMDAINGVQQAKVEAESSGYLDEREMLRNMLHTATGLLETETLDSIHDFDL